MFIFYDFETSSRELLGQIMTYSFFLVSSDYDILDELSGQIKLNRTQLPEIDAILTNRINIDQLQAHGQAEYEAAADVYHFLNTAITKYGDVTLVGFNSNAFDLGFLRNLLIGYGLNPYFKGKLKNLDLLHFSQFLAFQHPHDFPWVHVEKDDVHYYSFKLEDLTHSFGLLEGTQTHDARDDVLLTIKLARYLEVKFDSKLSAFDPIFFPKNPDFQDHFDLFKQKVRHYAAPDEPLNTFTYRYYLKLAVIGKSYLMVDLEKFLELSGTDTPLVGCLKYVNPNKQFFVLSSLDTPEYEEWKSVAETVSSQDFFIHLVKTPNHYFELIKKEWDIAYQIHELGFERIDTLKYYVNQLLSDPYKYPALLQDLLSKRKDPKDTYLIQLFNRVYLNTHPSPDPKYLMKYMEPRYITGTLNRNMEDFVPFQDNLKRLEALLQDPNLTESDLVILQPLLSCYKITSEAFHDYFKVSDS